MCPTLVISSMMFSDSVESLLWPPIMMMLEPVETAQDLNVIFAYFAFTYFEMMMNTSVKSWDLERTVGRSGPANQVSSRLASNTLAKRQKSY